MLDQHHAGRDELTGMVVAQREALADRDRRLAELEAEVTVLRATVARMTLHALSPRQFEEWVADYLRDQGFSEVERVGGAGDLGIDLRCRDRNGSLVLVQCKRYQPDRKIGSAYIQNFFGMLVHHGAERGIYVTTSEYTAAASKLAGERNIELINVQPLAAFTARKLAGERNIELIDGQTVAAYQEAIEWRSYEQERSNEGGDEPAVFFLRDALANGHCARFPELVERARENGIGRRKLEKAMRKLNLTMTRRGGTRNDGFGEGSYVVWCLPPNRVAQRTTPAPFK